MLTIIEKDKIFDVKLSLFQIQRISDEDELQEKKQELIKDLQELTAMFKYGVL